ncbi:hypothetical protein HYU18_01845 [Candidatus Woesearchaeota archaeon]|nr:hypothetical protein [Candidatus Woesearchaeota archaeon]
MANRMNAHNKGKNKTSLLLLALAVSVLLLVNQWQILSVSSALGGGSQSKGTKLSVKLSGDTVQDAIKAVIPTGTPEYGAELGVSFDDPVNSLNVLAKLDRQVPTNSLAEDEKTRFVNVGTKISCEFCCGAAAVIDGSGRDACGCSHAASFRGLSKYLIKNHPTEWTDDQILLELTKWKALYYPKNMVEKAVAALENGLELTPEVLNDRDLLKKISVGDTTSIGELPTMVGGC